MTRFAMFILLVLAGCAQEQPQEPANGANHITIVDAQPTPAAKAPASPPGASWLVGTWSFDTSCATDFLITYEANGSLDNRGETGTWALEGDTVIETLTARLENGGEEPVKVDPPETRSYQAVQTDAAHGVLTVSGRRVPIMRC